MALPPVPRETAIPIRSASVKVRRSCHACTPLRSGPWRITGGTQLDRSRRQIFNIEAIQEHDIGPCTQLIHPRPASANLTPWPLAVNHAPRSQG